MFERFLMTLPYIVGDILRFVFIVIVAGSMSFFFGQLLPRKNFDYKKPPYTPFSWEQNGMIYTKIGIQYWKDHVPDMSQYVKSAFRKRITVFRSAEYIEMLILETCVAEYVHFVLILLSPMFLLLMKGLSGIIGAILYALGNLPFIIIQRYNRPRLVKLMQCQLEREKKLAARKVALATSN